RWMDIGYVRSNDGGTSFGPYVPVPSGSDRWFSPHGPLLSLPNGRLIQTVYGDDGLSFRVWLLVSDDDGISWSEGPTVVASDWLRVTEAAAVVANTQGPRSTLLLVARTEPLDPTLRRGGLVQYVSRDDGATWEFQGNVTESASDLSPWLVQWGDRVILAFASRGPMSIVAYEATIDQALLLQWGPAATIYRSRLADRRPRPSGRFGYPSVVPLSVGGFTKRAFVFFDAAESDLSLGSEIDAADSDISVVVVPHRRPLDTIAP
ncbi:MAG: sialidase family protein, partial [Gammaproteobacteria bacterium]